MNDCTNIPYLLVEIEPTLLCLMLIYDRHVESIFMRYKTSVQQSLASVRLFKMSLVSGGISFMRIFAEVPRGGGVKRQWGYRKRQFSAFSLAIFSETLKMRPALLHSDTQSVVGFSVIPKCMTWNGYFALNSVFV